MHDAASVSPPYRWSASSTRYIHGLSQSRYQVFSVAIFRISRFMGVKEQKQYEGQSSSLVIIVLDTCLLSFVPLLSESRYSHLLIEIRIRLLIHEPTYLGI